MVLAKNGINVCFEKLNHSHLPTVFSWLRQDFVAEFWDNTQAHKDDILHFLEGRKTASTYADGKYVYWVASYKREPFALLMTIQETHTDPIGQEKRSQLSKTGNTYSIDYMIGNHQFLGKGYGEQTLSAFIDYFRISFDSRADTFLMDPAVDNSRAQHVYMKAGFEHVCDFRMEQDVSGIGKMHHLLVKRFEPA
jgi:RimJ/RimL family protein N-acetyltransferase